MSVTVIGLDGGPLPDAAMTALARASLVVGWPRQVELVRHLVPPVTEVRAVDRDLRVELDALAAAEGERVQLASGDPGFFGIVRAVAAEHDDVRVIPGRSSVSLAFAAAAMSWDDAQIVSAHGRAPDRALAVCRRLPKVAVLTEPRFGPADLGAALRHLPKRLVVAERLGHPDERITALRPAEAADRDDWRDPNVVLVLDDPLPPRGKGWAAPPRWSADEWGLPDEAFDHRDGMLTKREVRAAALARMGPGLGDLVWDVGTGSGSVGVECARLGAAVIALDDDADACERARANARSHGVPVEVHHRKAPEGLTGLPDPDAVFVGGGGHLLPEIVRSSAGRVRRVVVVALATVERIGPVSRLLDEAGLAVDGVQLAASRLTPLAGGTRLAAANPVFLLEGRVR